MKEIIKFRIVQSKFSQRTSEVPHGSWTSLKSHTKVTFVVSLKPLSFENVEHNTFFARMSIDKEIEGDLTATTKGQMLAARTGVSGSAGYVALEEVTGSLEGRGGTFVLQHSALMNKGMPSMQITVVPDSGTGELEGLTGDFKIDIVEGKHFYEFIYEIAN